MGDADNEYFKLVHHVLDNGKRRANRTGVDTISVFGTQTRYNLRESFPLLTTRKIFWRGIAEELLWFIKGSTDAKELAAKGVHIWDANGTREFLDKRGLGHHDEGDLGPVYGFQWRHFGSKFYEGPEGPEHDYTGCGTDQLMNVIHQIKTDPSSRRIIMSAWNPEDLPKMALPPCHIMCQFYVDEGELSCQMYQRSADLGLGVPFNIASYALLTHMIAHVCGLKVGDLVHTIGDAHVYVNHIEALNAQLLRRPFGAPTLRIKTEIKDIDKFTFDDFEMVKYECHPNIKMEMAV